MRKRLAIALVFVALMFTGMGAAQAATTEWNVSKTAQLHACSNTRYNKLEVGVGWVDSPTNNTLFASNNPPNHGTGITIFNNATDSFAPQAIYYGRLYPPPGSPGDLGSFTLASNLPVIEGGGTKHFSTASGWDGDPATTPVYIAQSPYILVTGFWVCPSGWANGSYYVQMSNSLLNV